MTQFSFLFGLVVAERILQHTDNLSKTLQNPNLTAAEAYCRSLLKTLQTQILLLQILLLQNLTQTLILTLLQVLLLPPVLLL